MINIYTFNDLNLDIQIILKPKNKKIWIRIIKPNILKITTPVRLNNNDIYKYVSKNYSYIKKVLNEKEEIKEDVIHLFGYEYKLKEELSNLDDIKIENQNIIIYHKINSNPKDILYSFYNLKLKEFVSNYLDEAKRKLNIDDDIIFEYKDVKTYFGECFYKRGKIILASKLAKYEAIYILSVIYHELAHFHYHNHQASFYNLLEKVFPDYKYYQHNLRKIKYRDIY